MRAVDLTAFGAGYLFREYGEDDSAWKRVVTRPICELRPHEGTFLPEVVTLQFDDGTERFLNPDDQVGIRAE
jgi:hypothetical protein